MVRAKGLNGGLANADNTDQMLKKGKKSIIYIYIFFSPKKII